jgi:hypothetical protein
MYSSKNGDDDDDDDDEEHNIMLFTRCDKNTQL